jgi:hypothetical protein
LSSVAIAPLPATLQTSFRPRLRLCRSSQGRNRRHVPICRVTCRREVAPDGEPIQPPSQKREPFDKLRPGCGASAGRPNREPKVCPDLPRHDRVVFRFPGGHFFGCPVGWCLSTLRTGRNA